MILTCPACATRYFVDDAAVPATGRAVRCAQCRTVWRAAGEVGAIWPEAAEPEAIEAETPASAIVEPQAMGDPLPNLFALRVAAEPRRRSGAGRILVWVLGAVVAVAGLVVLFRTEVERFWPATAELYAVVLGT